MRVYYVCACLRLIVPFSLLRNHHLQHGIRPRLPRQLSPFSQLIAFKPGYIEA
jgi:hypothetical protein